MLKKSLVLGIVLLFIVSGLVPNITGYNANIRKIDNSGIITPSTFQNGSLSGYVNDILGNPIEGVRIRVSFHNTFVENYSDSSGYYYVSNIPICFCLKNATASKAGYKSEWILLSIGENTIYDFVLNSLGKTLYVGGDGSGNYSKVQDAIDNASDRDVIYVYRGTYYEQLSITTSIMLLGEHKNTTFIDSNRTDGDTIAVYAEEVTIMGFTIQHSGKQEGDSGVKLHSGNNTIIDNIIRENGWRRNYYKQGGLYLNGSSHNIITNNVITGNREAGIYLHQADYNTIYNNFIYENGFLAIISNASSYNMIVQNDVYENFCGMTFWPYSSYNTIVENHVHDHPGCGIAFKIYSDYNIIRYNNFTNNLEWGIMLGFGPTSYNLVEYNTICGTTGGQQNWFDGSGLVLSIAFYNTVRNNNFLGNKNDVYLENSVFNLWNKNYWKNHQGSGVKIIKGHLAKPYIYHPEIKIPWIAIDWRPAIEPYDIPTIN